GFVAKRTRVDDRVLRIDMYIGDRKEIPVHTAGSRLLGSNGGKLVLQGRILRGSKSHRMRKRGSFIQSDRKATFKVCCDEQWQLRFLLKKVRHGPGFVRQVLYEEPVRNTHRQNDRA